MILGFLYCDYFYCYTFNSRLKTYPADLRLPPRLPGMVPPILTWLAPTAPGITPVPGKSLPISEGKK